MRFHQGTSEVLGRVSVAGPTSTDDRSPERARPIRVRLEGPAALTRGDRFILRAYSPTVTIGGGQVLDPDPPRARRADRGGDGAVRGARDPGTATDDRRRSCG